MDALAHDLGKVLDRSFPDDPRWRAFVKWWLDAKGYDYRAKRDLLVDGKGDGGIDVIARPNPELGMNHIFVVQSKYFQSSPPSFALDRFYEAVEAIQGPKRPFEAWLDSVRTDLHRTYRRLREQKRHIHFVLITSARLRRDTRRYLEKANIQVNDKTEISSLFESFKRGQTPRVSLIRVRAARPKQLLKSPEHKLWYARVSLRSLGQAYSKYGDDLFAGNVRYALKGENPAKVRVGIEDTIKNAPREFIYFHNGVTIVSKKLQFRAGLLHIESPSIVNGAQTVSFVGTRLLGKVPGNAYVLAKIVEVMPNYPYEKLETDIALSSNTQNKVDFSDLTVADPALVELDRGFRRYDCFLERKKGAAPGFRPRVRITKEQMVQIYAAIEPRLGSTHAKSPQQLFKREHAKILLRRYGGSVRGIEDSVCLAKLHGMCRYALRFSNQNTKRRAQIAYFAIFSAYFLALKETGRWKAVRRELLQNSNHWDTLMWNDIKSDVRYAAKRMLRISGSQRKNEPAFYKSKFSADSAVNTVVRRLRSRLRNHYWI